MHIFGYFFQKEHVKLLIRKKGTSTENFGGADAHSASPILKRAWIEFICPQSLGETRQTFIHLFYQN